MGSQHEHIGGEYLRAQLRPGVAAANINDDTRLHIMIDDAYSVFGSTLDAMLGELG